MLVVSVRPFERAANRLQTFEDSLGRDIPGERMALQRLVEHEVIELVTLTLCHTELAEEQLVRLGRRLLRDTAGNPFFTLEILRALLDQQRLDVALRADEDSDLPLPATLREFILRRLVPLSPQARSLLNLAAVVGRTFGWKTLLRASGQDREVVLVAIEELLAHVIIHAVGEGLFDFDHEKIRSVVYQDLSDPRRRHLHTMIAQTLEQIDGEQGTHVASIAYHYLHSDVPAPALPFLILAGDKANRLQAYSEADQHYLHALDLALLQPDQEQAAQIWMKRALNAMAAGMWQKAITCQEKALALYAWLRQTPSTHAPAVGRASETFRLVTSHGNQIQIDPSFGASREAWRVASQLFEGLVQLDPRMHVVPRLATRWEVLTGGRVYRFYLQKGLRWSDGTPLTAHDFVFAWRRTLQQAQRSSLASLLFDIVGAEEIAGDTEIEPTRFGARALRDDLLEVELRAPVRSFLYVMSLTIAFPQPQHAIERFGASWTEPGKIVTCGPYQLAAWESGRRLVLERASSYTGEFTGNVGQVELFIEMNPVLRCAMYHDHNVDMLGEMTYQEMTWARLMYPTELITRPALNTSYAAFSWRRPPFDQLAVRRAMAHAIDREEIGRQLLGNVESATGGFIPPGIGGHLAGGGLMFDPALARRLLADAGYPDGQGMGPITMVSCQGLDESNASLQEQWRRHLGVEVEISILETERQFEQWFAGGYHIMRQVRSITYPDPDNWLRHALLGLQVVAPDDPLISMVRAAAVLIDDRQRTAFYRQIDQMLVADRTAILPISYDTFYWLTRPWVRGYRYGPLGHWTPFKFLEIVRPQR
jgi:ABC-type oligopeptide transport system substrate-binding subunit